MFRLASRISNSPLMKVDFTISVRNSSLARTERRISYEVLGGSIASHFPRTHLDITGFPEPGTSRERCEAVDYYSLVRIAFRVPGVCRRVFSVRTHHGLLASRRFWRARILERCPLAEWALRSVAFRPHDRAALRLTTPGPLSTAKHAASGKNTLLA